MILPVWRKLSPSGKEAKAQPFQGFTDAARWKKLRQDAAQCELISGSLVKVLPQTQTMV